MPRHDAAVLGRLAEELIVPEAHGAAEQLAGGNQKSRMPEKIVKARRDAPGAERVEQHARRIGGFVGVVFVEKAVGGMIRVEQPLQFAAQRLDLLVREDADAL